MNMHERDVIVSNVESSRLAAEIAAIARNDEVMNFVKNVLDEAGLKDKITVKSFFDPANHGNDRERINPDISSIKINDVDAPSYNTGIRLEFEAVMGGERQGPAISTSGLSSNCIRSNNGFHWLLRAAYVLAEKLDELEKLINSEMFKSYLNDISTYNIYLRELGRFDAKLREEKISKTASAFHADMVLISNNGRRHAVIKATRKRVFLSNFTDSYGHVKKSIHKELLARFIVDEKWKIDR